VGGSSSGREGARLGSGRLDTRAASARRGVNSGTLARG
jgi:hypothetical protein